MRSVDAFHRVFPTSSWWKTKAWSVLLLAAISTVLLAVQLFCVFLIVNLFSQQGVLDLDVGQAEALTNYVHQTESGEKKDAQGQEFVPFETQIDNSGILPAVWQTRNHLWGSAVRLAYNSTTLLHDNQQAFLLLTFSLIAIGLVRSYLHARIHLTAETEALRSSNVLRKNIQRQALRLGTSDLEENSDSQALGLFLKEVDNIASVLAQWIERMGRNPITIVVLVAISVSINWRLALQCIVPLGFCWYIVKRENVRGERASRLAISMIERQSRLLAEGLKKPRLVRGYNMEEFEHAQFQKHMLRFEQDIRRYNQRKAFSHWVSRLIVLVCVTFVLYLVGIKVLLPVDVPDHMSLAAAIVMLLGFGAMWRPAEELYELRSLRRSAVISADEIYRYLNRIPEVGQAVGAKFLEPLSKSLEFEGVVYHRPGSPARPVLNRFDVRIPANSVTAIISTDPLAPKIVSYLLPRFIEPQKGRILFDGEDIAWVTLESLRAEAIYVGGQDPFFTGSVLENITCGQTNYSLTDATDAAKLAHAHNFVQRLSQGYETMLGEHGEQLEIGQGFQLGLARAIVRNPAMLIVEEPNTSLSEDTKKMLDDTYTRAFKKRTVIILPNRLSTLRRVDRIVFIHNGKVEAVGTHAELLKSQLYCHWEYMQFNEFRKQST